MVFEDALKIVGAMDEIVAQFEASSDYEETQRLLLMQFAEYLHSGSMKQEEFTILYWYTCGYRDGIEKGGNK